MQHHRTKASPETSTAPKYVPIVSENIILKKKAKPIAAHAQSSPK